MTTERKPVKRSHAKLVRAGIALALLAIATTTGCSWFNPPEPQPASTVQDWMRQGRPGGGFAGS
jgi:hypothetical protein